MPLPSSGTRAVHGTGIASMLTRVPDPSGAMETTTVGFRPVGWSTIRRLGSTSTYRSVTEANRTPLTLITVR